MRTPRNALPCVLAACAMLTQHACTTVEIHSEGHVRTEHGIGVLRVWMPDTHTSAVAVSGLGIAALPGSVTLGWVRWKGVSLHERSDNLCTIVDFGGQTGHEEER